MSHKAKKKQAYTDDKNVSYLHVVATAVKLAKILNKPLSTIQHILTI